MESVWQWLTGAFLLSIIGLVTYFLKRYVGEVDLKFTEIKTEISGLKSKYGDHEKTMLRVMHEINETASRFEKSGNEVHNKALSFQQDVNRELIKFKDQLLEVSLALRSVDVNASKINGHFEKLEVEVEGLVKRVDAHQGSLQLGAKAISHYREKISEHDAQIKTIITRIADDVVLISQKKKDQK